MEKDKIVFKKLLPVSIVFIEPHLSYKNIYKQLKMMYKNWCKHHVKTSWNESLIEKNRKIERTYNCLE